MVKAFKGGGNMFSPKGDASSLAGLLQGGIVVMLLTPQEGGTGPSKALTRDSVRSVKDTKKTT